MTEKKMIMKPTAEAYGITNETTDSMRVFFGDYDDVPLVELLIELDKLFAEFPKSLSPFLILESSYRNYHAINFGKVKVAKWKEMMEFSKKLDQNFVSRIKKYHESTLRVSPKYEVGTNKIIKERPNYVMWYYPKLVSGVRSSRSHFDFYLNILSYPYPSRDLDHNFDFDHSTWINQVKFQGLDKKGD